MGSIEEALKTAGAEDDLQTILGVLEAKSVGFKRHEVAAGPFASMDTTMLTGLDIRMLSAIRRAQQQQQHHQGAKTALVKDYMKPLRHLPAAGDFLEFLMHKDGRHIPVSLEAFDEADLPDILIPESTGGLSHISSLVEDVPFHGGEELTTGMMRDFIPVAMKSLLTTVSLPGSDYYLRFDYSGNKAEKRSSNPSDVLSRKLDRPDMLLVCSGATVLVGQDQASSDVDVAVYECRQRATCTKLSKILNTTSREALQHCSMAVSIIYLAMLLLVSLSSLASSIPLARCGHFKFPCYRPTAANLIKVFWMKSEFDMSSSKHRAVFLFAVGNLTRWMTLVAQQLPDLGFRLLLLKPWRRSEYVTITLQSGGRVYKQIKQFPDWVASHSPGSSFDFVAKVYQIASRHPNLVHTHKPPQLVLRKRDYEVTLEQYGPPANPKTLLEIHRLSHDCCAAAAALHAEGVVMRDFRLPNVLTRHGFEGEYVVVDMEYAGPDCTEWSLDLLDKWDAGTLNQTGQYGKMSDMHQIGMRIDSFPVSKPEILKTFVDLLMAKQLSALDALQHPWIVQA
ncbi:hypothetical protein ABBQ38_012975 [Trebouxia sp. C0009 RCD-2024]